MIRDLINTFPGEQLKELDLSCLGEKGRRHNNSFSSSIKLFVGRMSDQILCTVIMRKTVRS